MDQQQPPTAPDLQAQLQALLAQVQPQAAPSLASGWAKPQAATAPTGLAVPLSVETPNGKIRVYLDYPAEAAASPQAIMSLLESLANQGYPLDIWRGSAGSWGANRNSGGGWRR